MFRSDDNYFYFLLQAFLCSGNIFFQFGINYAKDPFYREIKRPTLDWRRAFAGHQRRGQSTAAATPLAAGYNSAITLC
ncbi:hypothetical protein NOM74_17065 [Klebsiella quasipneumoniae]|uniref:hypothetical protein n=1 Tax=Klebsiella quasipneumoniae TaxID=1463165 RepID=UPI00217D9DEC|nr:hypothetical protein [Klebsiella quasipneumoniae]MCS6746336.1 hypothetical protein [Klebsiella quasipneumoniae]